MKSSTRRLTVSRALPAEDDVQELRPPPLDRRQLLDVRADLEDGAGLHVAGELGVGDLVVPGAEGARRLARRVVHAEQEVGVAAPGPVEERGLVDDVRAGAHRRDRLGGRRLAQARRACSPLEPSRRRSRPSRSRRPAGPRGRRGSAARARGRAPRRARSSGRCGSASSTRPAIAARSSARRCPQARKPTRSVAAKTGVPSMSCIAGHPTGAGVPGCVALAGRAACRRWRRTAARRNVPVRPSHAAARVSPQIDAPGRITGASPAGSPGLTRADECPSARGPRRRQGSSSADGSVAADRQRPTPARR